MESAAGREKVKVSKIDGGSIHTWRALNPDGCGRGCEVVSYSVKLDGSRLGFTPPRILRSCAGILFFV
jgi:hypothetical protein